jgi:hypothetical protein
VSHQAPRRCACSQQIMKLARGSHVQMKPLTMTMTMSMGQKVDGTHHIPGAVDEVRHGDRNGRHAPALEVGFSSTWPSACDFCDPCQAERVLKKARTSARLHAIYARSSFSPNTRKNYIASVDQPPQPAGIAAASCPAIFVSVAQPAVLKHGRCGMHGNPSARCYR